MTKGQGTSKKKQKRKPVVGDNAALAGELMGVCARRILMLTRDELRHWAGQKSVLSRQIGDVLHAPFKPKEPAKLSEIPGPRSMRLPALEELPQLSGDQWLALYQRVYWEITGVEPGFQDAVVSSDPGGFGWVIAMTPEVPLNTFWSGPEGASDKGLKHAFPCWSVYGDDLESTLNWEREQRSCRNGAYAIRVRNREEADEEHRDRSAFWHEKKGTQVITLPERVVLEGLYWVVSGGKHLDVHNYTLCAGSRDRDGDVPNAYWKDGKFKVNSWYLRSARSNVRAREAVSA